MKLFAVFFISILTYTTTQAQKCRIEIQEDKFSSSIELLSKEFVLDGGGNFASSTFSNMGGIHADEWRIKPYFFSRDTIITLGIWYQDKSGYHSNLITSVKFKFDDGYVLTLSEPVQLSTTKFGIVGSNIYQISGSDLLRFATNKITTYRIESAYSNHKIVEGELIGKREKIANLFTHNASCIMEELTQRGLFREIITDKLKSDGHSKSKDNVPITGTDIPPLLLKKWELKHEYKDDKGNISSYVSLWEFFPDYSHQTTSHGRTTKARFEMANEGKYIIVYFDKMPPQTMEIVSLQEKVLILKGTKGSVWVLNSVE
ncbi:MAG: hypothetical protein KDE33_12860 [Bacteroidetes bacterium]|nr:hypothetical protein [Bacteroidota bacterium]